MAQFCTYVCVEMHDVLYVCGYVYFCALFVADV